MKVSIRLQNHGKRNHPYWWIVAAPNRRNNLGRFIQHLGYWSPRQGVLFERQIVFNIPRVMHWIANGAVPTYRVQKLLSLWDILPPPWYPPGKQTVKDIDSLSDKQKRKQQIKRKKKENMEKQPNYLNFRREENKGEFKTEFQQKMIDRIKISQRQNDILRQILIKNNLTNLTKIQSLSPNTKSVSQLKESLKKARDQLALLKYNYQKIHPLQKVKLINLIHNLQKKVSQAELKGDGYISLSQPTIKSQEEENQQNLKYMFQTEILRKKIQKSNQQFSKFSDLAQPVTIADLSDFLYQKEKGQLTKDQAAEFAQNLFITRGKMGAPITKLELLSQLREEFSFNDITNDFQEQDSDKFIDQNPDLNYISKQKKYIINSKNAYMPNSKPVNPFPDLKTYIPEEYYQPVTQYNLNFAQFDTIQPNEILKKYEEKFKNKK